VGEGSSREIDDDAGAAEVDEGDERLGGVKAEAAVADEADAAVEARSRPFSRTATWRACERKSKTDRSGSSRVKKGSPDVSVGR
jgi:hypothetical protein